MAQRKTCAIFFRHSSGFIEGVVPAAQRAFLHHLGETGAAGNSGLVQVTGHIAPAHRGQLHNKRTLDFVQFPMHKYPLKSLNL